MGSTVVGDLLHFEDFEAGQVWDLGSWTVTAEEIVGFRFRVPRAPRAGVASAAPGP